MEKKKEFITILNYAKYLAFILATVCVLVFQFTAKPICITLALAFYVVAFGLMFATLVVSCVELFKAARAVKEQKADDDIAKDEENAIEKEGIEGQSVEVVHLKKDKVLYVIGAILSGIMAVFTFIVLVLY